MTYRFDADPGPWMFQRDEIDLLEEELEDIYQTQEHRDPKESAMERSVMKEQLETEDRVESELVHEWGSELLTHAHAHEYHELTEELDDQTPLKELLHHQALRDPLYDQGLVWSREVFRFAKEHYTSGLDRRRDMFRVYLNAMMVPLKLSIGQMDTSTDDAFSLQVIRKEYELALTYLERTLESMQTLIADGYVLLLPFVDSGIAIRKNILFVIEHLGQPKGPNHHV